MLFNNDVMCKFYTPTQKTEIAHVSRAPLGHKLRVCVCIFPRMLHTRQMSFEFGLRCLRGVVVVWGILVDKRDRISRVCVCVCDWAQKTNIQNHRAEQRTHTHNGLCPLLTKMDTRVWCVCLCVRCSRCALRGRGRTCVCMWFI